MRPYFFARGERQKKTSPGEGWVGKEPTQGSGREAIGRDSQIPKLLLHVSLGRGQAMHVILNESKRYYKRIWVCYMSIHELHDRRSPSSTWTKPLDG